MDERHDFASCFTLNNLMSASLACYKGVRWKRQPQSFMDKRLTNCAILLDEIESGSYRPSKVQKFQVNERGKVRDVKPVAFRDRVAQRCFCDHVLIPAIESYVVDDCSAVLPGRGLDLAFSRVREHAKAAGRGSWVVKYDFSNYFASIDQDALLCIVSDLVPDRRLFEFARTVITEEPSGLDLGSHINQLCATAYPTLVDRAVMAMDGVVGYHRYMDDGIVFCDGKRTAAEVMGTVRDCSEILGLSLNGKKTYANRIEHPFVFCKMRFTLEESGNVRMNVRKKQSRRAVKHAKSVVRLSRSQEIDLVPVKASLDGYLGRGDADLSRLSSGVFEDIL